VQQVVLNMTILSVVVIVLLARPELTIAVREHVPDRRLLLVPPVIPGRLIVRLALLAPKLVTALMIIVTGQLIMEFLIVPVIILELIPVVIIA